MRLEDVAQGGSVVLIETARAHRAVAVNDRAKPDPATVIPNTALKLEGVIIQGITAMGTSVGEISSPLIGVLHLHRFEGNLVHLEVPSERTKGLYFVLIMFHNEKLELDVGSG